MFERAERSNKVKMLVGLNQSFSRTPSAYSTRRSSGDSCGKFLPRREGFRRC